MNLHVKKLLSVILFFTILANFSISTPIIVRANTVIESMISWALATAANDNIGYSQNSSLRNGPDYYDCSSFVITACKNAGINVGSASTTRNMIGNLEDFEWITWDKIGSESNLKRGDILLYVYDTSIAWGHTEIYLGNGQNVGAHSANRPKADQVSVSGYYYHPWDGVLRYKGTPELYTIDLIDNSYIRGDKFKISGHIGDAGTSPSIKIYVDYGLDSSVSVNNNSDYSCNLDTTKYSDGSHLIGIKIVNQDGLDYTLWRNVVIDNTPPSIKGYYISQKDNNGYRICIVPNDVNDISQIRVATWTTSNQSDLLWHSCYFNGYETYYIDISRKDYNIGASHYNNHIYYYDKAGNAGIVSIDANYDSAYSMIKDTYISQVSANSFRVCCTVNNPDDVETVRVATWTTGDQSDLIWHDCYYNGFGTYFIDLNRSDYKNINPYINHIYVYGQNGQNESSELIYSCDTTPPVISDIEISNINNEGYTISCKITDDSKIGYIKFPTWTAKEVNGNSQDDIDWYVYTLNTDSNSVMAYHRVKTSEHNQESGIYYNHIYATDNLGNEISIAAPSVNVPSAMTHTPVDIFDYNGSIYAVYNEAMSWTSADALCKEMGGHLVTITNENENQEILKHVDTKKYRYWIGLRSTEDGSYEWSNGEEYVYSNWDKSQPDNYNNDEKFIQLWNGIEKDTWNDSSDAPFLLGEESYKYGYGFIMEVEMSKMQLSMTETLGNNKYEFYSNLICYPIAKYYATLKNGKIVDINSAEENDFVHKHLNDWYFWIGLEKISNDFLWYCVGKPEYLNWNNGEPNNNNGIEECVVMAASNGKWNDTYAGFYAYTCIEYENGNLKGDINLDGKIDKKDATLLLKYISSIIKLTYEQLYNADINNDGKVDILDVTTILNIK